MKKIILFFAIMGFIGCTGSQSIILKGKVSVKGSFHHYLNIKDIKSNKSYKIQNSEAFDLIKKQNQVIKVKVKLIKEAIGPGFPAVIEVLQIQ
ncbi:MAG: hypothetical protein U9O24_03320 [Campylobacterota bacterium]|nr:hypothetical protein [Campylobacterota bacterium]